MLPYVSLLPPAFFEEVTGGFGLIGLSLQVYKTRTILFPRSSPGVGCQLWD
jgi:hypothetical protein